MTELYHEVRSEGLMTGVGYMLASHSGLTG